MISITYCTMNILNKFILIEIGAPYPQRMLVGSLTGPPVAPNCSGVHNSLLCFGGRMPLLPCRENGSCRPLFGNRSAPRAFTTGLPQHLHQFRNVFFFLIHLEHLQMISLFILFV